MKTPLMDRITSKIDASGDCWLWTASRDLGGYAQINAEKIAGKSRIRKVHRLLYELLVGPVPPGLELDHLCRVRHCVNPDHLQPVTRRVNAQRGIGRPANWPRNIPCKRGHDRSPENTYVNPNTGKRRCRPCMAIDFGIWYARQKRRHPDASPLMEWVDERTEVAS